MIRDDVTPLRDLNADTSHAGRSGDPPPHLPLFERWGGDCEWAEGSGGNWLVCVLSLPQLSYALTQAHCNTQWILSIVDYES